MTTQVSLPCLKCGRPANPEHHQPPDRNSKGMGGTSDPDVESWRVPLCRQCHDSLHAEKWRLRIEGGIAIGFDLEGNPLFSRPYEPLEVVLSISSYPEEILPLREQMGFVSDENLAYFIGRALIAAKTNILNIGMAADVFRERYAQFGDGWYIRAAEYIRDNNQEGQSIGARELYAAHSAYLAFRERPEVIALLPNKSVVYACAEAPDPQAAVDFCDKRITAGQPVKVRDIREQFGQRESPVESDWEDCPTCGGRGRIRKNG